MNLEDLKNKLSGAAADEKMLGRWINKLSKKPKAIQRVTEWAKNKKDKRDLANEFHAALNAEEESVKPKPQEEPALRTRFARLSQARDLRN